MRHVARVGMILAVLLAGIVLPGSAAQACRCIPGNAAEHLQTADAVFYGEIVDRTPIPRDDEVSVSTMANKTYTVAVDQVFKGEVYAEQIVVAGGSSSSCGLTLPGSGTVLVYGSVQGEGSPPRYITSSCSGTEITESVPAVLGAGDPPIATKPALEGQLTVATDDDDAGASPVVIGGAALLLLAGLGVVGVVLWRRRPSGGAA